MKLAPKVVRLLRAENIKLEELYHMVKHAAICRGFAPFNRMYHHWLFKIDGETVDDMRRTEHVTVGDPTDNWVYEEHEACKGEGCHECGWAGEVQRYVTDLSI